MAGYGGDPQQFGGGNARDQVKAPALTLLITSAVFMVLNIIFFFASEGLNAQIIKFAQGMQAKQGQPVTPVNPEDLKPGAFQYLMLLVTTGVGALCVFGALKMQNLESYAMAMTASILAMVPFISPCCCIGLPIGIWALVVINRPDVKSAFRG